MHGRSLLRGGAHGPGGACCGECAGLEGRGVLGFLLADALVLRGLGKSVDGYGLAVEKRVNVVATEDGVLRARGLGCSETGDQQKQAGEMAGRPEHVSLSLDGIPEFRKPEAGLSVLRRPLGEVGSMAMRGFWR